MLASLCMRFLLVYMLISVVLTPFPVCVTFSNTLEIPWANQWHPGDLESMCSAGPCLQWVPSVPTELDECLPCVLPPLCGWGNREEDLNLPEDTALAVPDPHYTQPINFSGGINIFSLLMLFRKPCESFPNTSIVSVHTFLMRLPSVAKEFVSYSKVLVNLQTIAPDCLLLWQEDRHCSFGLTFFQICTLSETEDPAVTSVIRVLLEHATIVAVKEETGFQEDGQKDSFPRAKYSSKWELYPK